MNDKTANMIQEAATALAESLAVVSPEDWTNGNVDDMVVGAMTELVAVATVETVGRTDLGNLFAKSGLLEEPSLDHTPFLAFVLDGGAVVVNVVKSAQKLASDFPPETPVMVQWPGKWRSDYFKLTVADVKEELDRRKNKAVCDTCGVGANFLHIGQKCNGHWPGVEESKWCQGTIIAMS